MSQSLLYEGKAKKVYQTPNKKGQLILAYKNDATAFNGQKKALFEGKGRLNNEISSRIFQILHQKGIETHFIEQLNETEQLVHQTKIIPMEVVIRNMAAGSITKRLGIEERTIFSQPLIELFYKEDSLGDPLMNDEHALFLCNVTFSELREIKAKALEINTQLIEIFAAIGITLVDFKMEFGRLASGDIVLADEISPDTCRLWDVTTHEKLDKDVFRQGTGNLIEVYEEIRQRLEAIS
ncbi:phosphoribosylaminoimidazolesuccinocarboxamide synthase [Virgibacillus halodenitrificans]|uniref:Phosphoribosylaminoimidazole-succinocarboxamide synthase n=1 Tax=Virgibacillus halodenitrificans TaxID=1482 RepID=A0AAC9IXJ2_VIRHA|nr:phosphoribosylaminoimidazolesuccinocarboxamide synthase [Virgibacillus halodenitrificans]APC47164.1 phosphoribosylaminoimidazolesuccinocarboxamide synthase [Virgibacillus halodenitrificans]MEC2159411.1 phosphoribosylaminoimidazolesuccinocarboxamide synthase [Virgibacillus halodenitrificans]